MNELKNREQRLRYVAEKKGLVVQKQSKETHTGYLIVKADSKLVVAGYDHFDNLLSIEEAEKFVEEYWLGDTQSTLAPPYN